VDIASLGPEVDAAHLLLRETQRVAARFITCRLAQLSASEILRALWDIIRGPFKGAGRDSQNARDSYVRLMTSTDRRLKYCQRFMKTCPML
jgi:hypothetical protein